MSLSGQNVARGEIQRAFKRVPLVQFIPGTSDQASVTMSLEITGMSKSVNMNVSAGFVLVDNTQGPRFYPAGPGTIQITPITKGEGTDVDLYGNPIFSSPNFAGALTLPNGWEFATMVPKCRVDVVVNPTPWDHNTAGLIVVDILAEYTGKWWDPGTVAMLLNRITVLPLFTNPVIKVGGA